MLLEFKISSVKEIARRRPQACSKLEVSFIKFVFIEFHYLTKKKKEPKQETCLFNT
jgi:hypothetical protein